MKKENPEQGMTKPEPFSIDAELERINKSFDKIAGEIALNQREVAFHQDQIKMLVDEQIRLQGEHRMALLMQRSQQETK